MNGKSGIASVLIVLVALGATLGFVALVGRTLGPLADELKLPLLIVTAVVGLLGSLALVVIVFAVYQLTDKKYALALPDGSIRGVMALLLIVLFAVLTVFLTIRLGNITDAQRPVVDFAKQLLTILGTLMTSVASFYFGTRAATDGAQAAAARKTDDTTDPNKRGGGTTPAAGTLPTATSASGELGSTATA